MFYSLRLFSCSSQAAKEKGAARNNFVGYNAAVRLFEGSFNRKNPFISSFWPPNIQKTSFNDPPFIKTRQSGMEIKESFTLIQFRYFFLCLSQFFICVISRFTKGQNKEMEKKRKFISSISLNRISFGRFCSFGFI